MSRVVKFRAWHFELKKMFSAKEMTDDQMALLPDGYFSNIHSSSTKLSQIYSHYEMLPLQYTGLHDKNGKEIYEGDIVVSWNNKDLSLKDILHSFGAYKIFWSDEFSGWCSEGTKYGINAFYKEHGLKMEVIGNIYENPELLKS